MANELRTNTATKICVGPFYLFSDGLTPKVDATVANARITAVAETDDNSLPTLILDNVAGNDGTNTLAHITGDDAGYYSLLLTAANINRLGRFKIAIENAAEFIPVFHEFEIVSAQYFDAKYGAGSFLADLAKLLGTAPTEGGAGRLATGLTKLFDVASPVLTAASVNQTGDSYPIVNHTDYGNAKLVRSTTPANTLTVDASVHGVLVTDKTGFSLLATGADLILKSSTFVQAIVAAIDEFATRGLAAIYTLLTATGIKAATIPNATLANGAHGGAAATITLQTPISATVPDTQKVDVNTMKTKGVSVDAGGTTFPAVVGTSTYAGGAVASVTSYGTLVADIATAVWGAATRTLSAFAFTVAATVASVPDSAGVTTLLARVGAFTGTGINTVLGFFKALMSKTASAPSDLGGTMDPATDSVEGIRDTEPLGTAMRGTDSAMLAASYVAPPSAASIADAVLDEAGATHTGLIPTNLDAKVSTISGGGGGDATEANQLLILAAISSIGGGTGSTSWPITIEDGGGNTLADVDVAIRTGNTEASPLAASGKTDAFGVMVPTPMLDPGTYYVWRQKTGVDFSNPQTIVVT